MATTNAGFEDLESAYSEKSTAISRRINSQIARTSGGE
jgi:hypothetical protein